jgi:hypothetical protein
MFNAIICGNNIVPKYNAIFFMILLEDPKCNTLTERAFNLHLLAHKNRLTTAINTKNG